MYGQFSWESSEVLSSETRVGRGSYSSTTDNLLNFQTDKRGEVSTDANLLALIEHQALLIIQTKLKVAFFLARGGKL